MSFTEAWPGLRGRQRERDALSRLLTAAKGGRGQALVLRGEAGIGKSALLGFLAEQAAGCRIGRATGSEAERELAFAGLHQLCGPYLDRLDRLPGPQRDALGSTFGLAPGNAPDPFLVGLAVLTLLGEVARERPLILLVEDVHQLDRVSAETLRFVARRLTTEPLGLLLATRTTFPGLPELLVPGLSDGDGADLLAAALTGPLDPRVRDRILAEARGNPRAILDVPRTLTPTELAYGGDPGPAAPIQATLPATRLPQTRPLLLVAAADPTGDVPLLWRAARRLGLGTGAAASAEEAGLIELGDRVRFRDPLLRAAVYRTAALGERRAAHRALADATDPGADPDRRAWHRAHAAAGPDETIAGDLERSAGRALLRGGMAASASFLATAAALTPDPARRARRSLDAARAKAGAGAFAEALSLLALAESGPLDEAGRARAGLVRARVAYRSGGGDTLPLLLTAARQLDLIDPMPAREAYLDALSAALLAGHQASALPDPAHQVARIVREVPGPDRYPRPTDLLLDGLAVLGADGYPAAVPLLHRAVRALGGDALTMREAFRSSGVAAAVAADLWDDEHWDVLSRRCLDAIRRAGAFGLLPAALAGRAVFQIHSGDLPGAATLVAQVRWLTGPAAGEHPDVRTDDAAGRGTEGRGRAEVLLPAAWLAAVRGDEQPAERLIAEALDDAKARGAGVAAIHAARAVLCNGLGRYEEAASAASDAVAAPLELGAPKWALAELVEAGVRSGNQKAAGRAFEQLSAMTRAAGTELALGVEAGRRALLRNDRAAEDLYREAIERLGRTRIRVERARAKLLYGEWLRRVGRRADARVQLREAYEELALMGVAAFADRARRELLATGETVRKRTVAAEGDLTAQEEQIAGLAVQGLTNPEIAATLFISPRTVEWHLRKVFAKVGVGTRRELRRALSRRQAQRPA
ncbi:AAA family ATPase [Paractinoplanes toevensis]|uniref:Transcriptional regulator n=1 Tax=Paractinoplanes toevensis TaxID=571911 RepID=A0A919T922_9ACTN|nr:LuxR family transcriptional regulator [Actinoplanes toevensis]GIM89801.1 transcriptional regulator [Actinoplanes toevensis]